LGADLKHQLSTNRKNRKQRHRREITGNF